MKVALFGGAFDPPHVGHVVAATFVRSALGFDEVWWVPSFAHPFGKAMTPFPHRVAMCRLAAADLGPWAKVSEVESTLSGKSFTVDVLEALIVAHPDVQFAWTIGSDVVPDLPKWKQWDRIKALATLVVLNRAGHPDPSAVGPALVPVSSTEVRERLASKRSCEGWVPKAALGYVKAHGLYGAK